MCIECPTVCRDSPHMQAFRSTLLMLERARSLAAVALGLRSPWAQQCSVLSHSMRRRGPAAFHFATLLDRPRTGRRRCLTVYGRAMLDRARNGTPVALRRRGPARENLEEG